MFMFRDQVHVNALLNVPLVHMSISVSISTYVHVLVHVLGHALEYVHMSMYMSITVSISMCIRVRVRFHVRACVRGRAHCKKIIFFNFHLFWKADIFCFGSIRNGSESPKQTDFFSMKKIEIERDRISVHSVRTIRNGSESPHETNRILLFHEKDRNRTEADRISIIFGSFFNSAFFPFFT